MSRSQTTGDTMTGAIRPVRRYSHPQNPLAARAATTRPEQFLPRRDHTDLQRHDDPPRGLSAHRVDTGDLRRCARHPLPQDRPPDEEDQVQDEGGGNARAEVPHPESLFTQRGRTDPDRDAPQHTYSGAHRQPRVGRPPAKADDPRPDPRKDRSDKAFALDSFC